MGKKIRSNFFDEDCNYEKVVEEVKKDNENKAQQVNTQPTQSNVINYNVNPKLMNAISDLKEFLIHKGYKTLLSETEKIEKTAKYNKFKVSVVGEFSRGKSTLINNILGTQSLPVGDLPTTAMLTKITYSKKNALVYVNQQGKKETYPINESSWDKLSISFEKETSKGIIFLGNDCEWLNQNNIEIIDTPGAGDIDNDKATIINEAIIGADGLIITISAVQAFSHTEELFIKERILTQKFPHLMIALTRIDQIKSEDRETVIKYALKKIYNIEPTIPLFVTCECSDISGSFDNVKFGVNSIKEQLELWSSDEQNNNLKNEYISSAILNIITILENDIVKKEELSKLSCEEQKEKINKEKTELEKIIIQSEKLENDILQRCNVIMEDLSNNIRSRSAMIIEQLQYESSHSNNLQNWWDNDYPYRMKIEMMKISGSLDNELNNKIAMDVKWINQILSNLLNEQIGYSKQNLTDKDEFQNAKSSKKLELDDVSKTQNYVRIGTGAVSIAGYILLAGTPFAMMTSISSGVIGTFISQNLFKKKLEEQRQVVNNAIAEDVPKVLDNSILGVEKKLREMYDSLIKQANEKMKMWYDSQIESLDKKEADKENKIGLDYEAQFEEIHNISVKILDKKGDC